MYRFLLFIHLILALGESPLYPQTGISGRFVLDSTHWAPSIYLSHILDLSQMNAISYRQIIAQADLTQDGSFSFSTELFPDVDQLYRIHLVKKGDPPATLMIGGREQNHFFLLARQGSQIILEMQPGDALFDNLSMEGYEPNLSLLEIEKVVKRLNAVDQVASSLNRDFTRDVLYDQLRAMADSSEHPLVSLYALNASNYKEHYLETPAFYKRYIRRWRLEKTEYHFAFRQELGMSRRNMHPAIAGGGALLLLLIMLSVYFLWWKKRQVPSPYTLLTIQERKVFDLLKEGRSNKEIAVEFNVSVSTVKSHVNSIFSKLDVKSRREIMNLPFN